MAYFIFDEKIYYENEGAYGSFSKEDGLPDSLKKIEDVCVSVVDVDIKVISAPENKPELKDIEINKHFDPDYVIQDERINRNLFQVVGINKNTVQEIYQLFKSKNIKVFVPYALSLRAYLNKIQINTQDKCLVFVDDYKDGVFITIFDQLKFTKTRRIVKPIAIANEIIRTQQKFTQGYAQQYNKDPQFLFVCNNKEIADEIVASKVTEAVIFIEDEYPALDGLRSAKFGMHFLLPVHTLKKRRIKEMKNWFVFSMASLVLFIFGIGFYAYTVLLKQSAQENLTNFQQQKKSIENKLELTNKETYRDQIKELTVPGFAQVNYQFLISLPAGYEVDYCHFKQVSSKKWIFEAVIYLIDKSQAIMPFPNYGIFKNREVEYIVIKDRPGQHIILEIGT